MLLIKFRLMKRKTILKKILVVEDNILVASMIRFILEIEGFTVSIASDGEEAMDILNDESFDLIISDVMMPKINGFVFAKAVRAMSNVPIIILTALSGAKSRKEGFECGATYFITKPFDPKDLLSHVKSALASN